MLTPWQRLAVGALAAFALTCAGVVGYMTIEGMSFFDAVYQTVTTITTAGFGEVEPLSTEGRVFTLGIIVLGIIVILYVLSCVMQIALAGEIESILGARRMRGRIGRLSDHHIICGFGRVGTEIASEFLARKVPFVIVESNPEAIERARRKRYPLVLGEPSDEAGLKEAGIERARSLLAASDSDTGNAYTLLTASSLNPDVFLVGRAAHPEAEVWMRKAGAQRVLSPYLIAGRQMAMAAVQPTIAQFIEAATTERKEGPALAELEVSPGLALAGTTIGELVRERGPIVVLGLQKASLELIVGPEPDTAVNEGDRLILMGETRQLETIRVEKREVAHRR